MHKNLSKTVKILISDEIALTAMICANFGQVFAFCRLMNKKYVGMVSTNNV